MLYHTRKRRLNPALRDDFASIERLEVIARVIAMLIEHSRAAPVHLDRHFAVLPVERGIRRRVAELVPRSRVGFDSGREAIAVGQAGELPAGQLGDVLRGGDGKDAGAGAAGMKDVHRHACILRHPRDAAIVVGRRQRLIPGEFRLTWWF